MGRKKGEVAGRCQTYEHARARERGDAGWQMCKMANCNVKKIAILPAKQIADNLAGKYKLSTDSNICTWVTKATPTVKR